MDGRNVIGQHACVPQSGQCPLMYVADRYKYTMAAIVRRRLSIMFQRETARHGCIMAADPEEDADKYGSEDQDKPGAITKFCDGKDQHDNGRADRAESIAEHFDEPALFIAQFMPCYRFVVDFCVLRIKFPCAPPASCHACLRECEGQEYSNRIKRDQTSNT